MKSSDDLDPPVPLQSQISDEDNQQVSACAGGPKIRSKKHQCH